MPPRVVAHLAGAAARAMGGGDPTEPLALARLACDVPEDDPYRSLLSVADGMIAAAEAECADLPGSLRRVVGPAICAALMAGTPSVRV
jgi:hypothetical protein